jgi:hypothetical protein
MDSDAAAASSRKETLNHPQAAGLDCFLRRASDDRPNGGGATSTDPSSGGRCTPAPTFYLLYVDIRRLVLLS